MKVLRGLGAAAAVTVLTILLCSAGPAPTSGALTKTVGGMCPKSGERTSGFNKVCYYNCLGNEVAQTIGSTQLCPLSINGAGPAPPKSSAPAAVCFKKGEERTGQAKQCAYDCLGSLRVMTVGSTQMCPMTIRQ